MFVFLNGKIIDEKKAVVGINDHGFLYGDGVYETLRTANGKIWQFSLHMERLRKSLRKMRITYEPDEKFLHEKILELIKKNKLREARIRITVTRGENKFVFDGAKNPTVLITVCEPDKVDSKLIRKGVAVATMKVKRVLPGAKSISLLPMIMGKQYAADKQVYETVFVNEKSHVLEGTVTNIFIIKKGFVYTPGREVLNGTTRNFIVRLARKNGYKVKIGVVTKRFLKNADEIFITNAPKGIIPVVEVDGVQIGKPGIITKELIEIFNEHIANN
ncbi:hypothetical protein GF340_04685 [Candidatus Peregrinibacteria bacterium]|nr:hypothetical protein [Candidatus Peregrinibacteria bacterium]